MSDSPVAAAELRQSRIKILFFGYVADRLGREMEFDLPPGGCSIAELRRALAEREPKAAGALSSDLVRACVDGMIVAEEFSVLRGQEVAFIPPVSGG